MIISQSVGLIESLEYLIGDEQMGFGNSSYASFDKSWIHWIHIELDL